MRVPVGGVAPDGLAEPVERGGHVAGLRVRVAGVERKVGHARLGVGRLREEVGRQPLARRLASPQLDDAQIVEQRRAGLLVGQRPERLEGLAEPAEIGERQRGLEPRAPRERRVGRHAPRRQERRLVLTLLAAHGPERQPRAVVARVQGNGPLEEARLGRGRLRHEALHVVLEGFDRRVDALERRRPGAAARGKRQPPGHALEDGEQVAERPLLDDVLLEAARLEIDPPRAHRQRVVLDFDRPRHDRRRAEHLAHLDDRRATGRGGARQTQQIERVHALGPGQRGDAERVQIVGQEDGRALAQPVERRVVAGPVKRHDERGTRLVGPRDGGGGDDERQRERRRPRAARRPVIAPARASRRAHAASAASCSRLELPTTTDSEHPWAPVPRQASTCARAGTAKRSKMAAKAAA